MGSFFPTPFSQAAEYLAFFTAPYMLQGASGTMQHLQPGHFSQHKIFPILGHIFSRVYILQHLILRDVQFHLQDNCLISFSDTPIALFQERPDTDPDKQVKDQIKQVQNRIKE